MVKLMRKVEASTEPELEISGEDLHEWNWHVGGGQFASLEVEQRGIDVVVRLFSPGVPEAELEVDGLNGEWGTERLSVAPGADADYRVVIVPGSPSADPGRYLLRASEPRAASDADRRNVVAERLFDGAERLRRKGGNENLRQSLAGYRGALDIFEETGAHEWRLVARHRLGWVSEGLELQDEARAAYLDLLELSRQLGRQDEEAATLNRLGRLDFTAGQDAGAEKRFREALGIAEALGDARLRAACLNNLASVLFRREDLAGALEQFEKVHQIWMDLESPRHQALTLFNRSRVLQAQGKFPEAIDVLEEALTLRVRAGDDVRVAETEIQLGSLYRRLGDGQKAIDLYQQALTRETEKLPSRLRVVLANDLGLAYAETGQPKLAADRFAEAMEEAGRLGIVRFEAMAALNLSAVRQQAGDAGDALNLLARARSLFQELDDRRNLAACDLIEGLAYRGQGRLQVALERLESAVSLVEALRLDHTGWEFRMSFYATRQTYFDELIDLLVDLHAADGDGRYLEQALQASERRRARSLLDALAEGRLDFKGDPAMLDEERRLTTDLAEADRELRLSSESSSEAHREELLQERRRLLVRLESVRAAIRRSSPQYAELTRPQPLDTEAIRNRVLDAHTCLLVYSLGEKRSFLWTLDQRSSLQVFELPGRKVVEDVVEETRMAMMSRSLGRQERNRRRLERLADLVLGPLAGHLDGRRLAIVADGILHSVPFSALPEPRAEDGAPFVNSQERRPWLIEGREVVHLPSASTLAALRAEYQGRPQAPYDIAVFADPVFSKKDGRFREQQGAGVEGDPPLPKGLHQALRDLGPQPEFSRLPATGTEAQAISAMFPEHQQMKAVSFDASRKTFEEADLEQFRVLHFATHGILDLAHPELSGLVLSLIDRDGQPVDGFIRAHEVYSRQFTADLVVLSACQTGLGREVRGEGLVGLQRGFLYAGVPRIVVSLWNVADESTAELMASFYHELGEGQSPAAALRKAQLSMLASEDPERRLPFHWGAFIFLGDWQNVGSLDGGIGESDLGEVVIDDPNKGSSYEKRVEGVGTVASDAIVRRGDVSQAPRQPAGFVNGVKVETGTFLSPDPNDRDLKALQLSPRNFRRLRHWVENHHPGDPERKPMHGVDPENLAQSGWAVMFAPDVTSEVREALAPLLKKRESQAGEFFERIEYDGSDALTFLGNRGVVFGPAVPEKLPYYLLLVGDPSSLPFELQYQLDVQYAVGRLHFDEAQDYADYARSVLAAEEADGNGREAVFWGTDVAGDIHSQWMMEGLLDPLYEDLHAWKPSLYKAEKAVDGKRATLMRLFGKEPPAFLFTASHGVVFSHERGFPLQREYQGALLCEDWQRQAVQREHYFAAEDLASDIDLQGLITAHFACYSAGCSEKDSFDRGLFGRGKRLAYSPFVSRLCQRLLMSGAQAAVGHVDRAWETSFRWNEKDDAPRVFMSMLRQLVEGHRLGHAMEWIHQRYAECSTQLNPLLEARLPLDGPQAAQLRRLRKVTLDTRNYLVIGDPAVRLVGAEKRRRSQA